MLRYVDTHCHLEMHDSASPAEQIERARAAGVTTQITVGTDMATSTGAVQLANRYDGVWAVVGVHPNDAMEASPAVLEIIDRLAAQDRVVGIGETGLDYYREYTTPEQQAASYRSHIAMAKKHDKTLVIHCREAWDDTLRILEEEGAPDRVVMHCFSGDLAVTEHCMAKGYYMSFAGNATFKNAEPIRAAIAKAPLELLLTETDSPFLTPHPHRGERNESHFIPLVTQLIADVQSRSEAEVAEATVANAYRAFALPDEVDASATAEVIVDAADAAAGSGASGGDPRR